MMGITRMNQVLKVYQMVYHVLSENGSELSGGQSKYRSTRALVMRQFILFDEPTSAMT